jgi:hypothetical protein
MNREQSTRRASADQPISCQPLSSRFSSLYGKPKTLTDRYDECSDEAISHVLGKSEAELGWNDFNMLFRVGVAPATYEEGLCFLPAALAFLRRPANPDAVDCIADVLWFVSEHAARMEQDGLLPDCHDQVLALLQERTAQFVVVHWDREKNRQMGRDRDHFDYVEDSQLVCDTIEALLRFETLGTWAAEFLNSLGRAENEPIKSAWFLECVEKAGGWALFRRKTDEPGTTSASQKVCAAIPELRVVWEELQTRGFVKVLPDFLAPDTAVLKRHVQVIRRSGELIAKHPTYWSDRFAKLGLADLTIPGHSHDLYDT